MSKEVHVSVDADQALVTGAQALPDPGGDKKLIVFVRASSIHLHVVDMATTLVGQETGSGGGG